MKSLVGFGLALMSFLLMGTNAYAYKIGSAFSDSCHERMSTVPLAYYLESLGEDVEIVLPESDLWRVSQKDLDRLVDGSEALAPLLGTDRNQFVAFSLLSGLRYPDTHGYSITDVNAARGVHGDLTKGNQYAHALRASDDTGDLGDVQALEGLTHIMQAYFAEIESLLAESPKEQLIPSHVYLDHYGRVEVEVWGPAWIMGQALHALQDSHSHAIRTEDAAYVLHILNYIDAYSNRLEEDDGLAHSNGMDDCSRPELASLVQTARDRSMALVSAMDKLRLGDGGEAASFGLMPCPVDEVGRPECGWFTFHPECQARLDAGETLAGTCCSRETRFCDSPYLDLVESTPSRPYLKAVLDCAWTPRSVNSAPSWATLFFIGAIVLTRRRRGAARRRERGRRAVHLQRESTIGHMAFGVAILATPTAKAERTSIDPSPLQGVLRAKAHAAYLSGRATGAFIDASFGPRIEAGFRKRTETYGHLGLFGFVEQDSWVAQETEGHVDSGALSFGIGGEWLYLGFFRTAATFGPSVLLFDTPLHQAGSVGLFLALEPLGMVWTLNDAWAITFDPVSLAWVNPTPEGGSGEPSLGHLQYRTGAGVEWTFR